MECARSTIFLFSCAVALWCISVSDCQPQILWTQTDGSSSRGLNCNHFVNYNGGATAQVADDFDVPPDARWDILSLTYNGFFANNSAPYVTGWMVRFYGTGAGQFPIPVSSSVPNSLEFEQMFPVVTPPNASPSFSFDPPVQVFPGKHWVSVVAIVESGFGTTYRWLCRLRNSTAVGLREESGAFRFENLAFSVPDVTHEEVWVPLNDENAWGDGSTIQLSNELLFTLVGTSQPYTNPTTGQVTTGQVTTEQTVLTTGQTLFPTSETGTTGQTISTPTGSDQGSLGDSSSEAGSNGALIGGLVGGILAFVLLVIVLGAVVFFFIRSTRRSSHLQAPPMSDRPTMTYSNEPIPLKQMEMGSVKYTAPIGVPGKYEIDFAEIEFGPEIGRGAYGVVYRGYWRGGIVAIKKLLIDKLVDQELDDFRREASVMGDLRPHTNVVQFLGITSSPQLCIITEYLEGGSLYEYLTSEAKTDGDMVVNWVKGIAAGMLHLHTEGIIHRDCAARNVLLNVGTAKITDFGLSRVLTSTGGSSQTQSTTGPLKWMAPESIERREYSVASDSWAFGVVLWEIVTRETPYLDMTPIEVAMGVTKGNPPLRLTIPRYCPTILAQLMEQCFQTKPEARPTFKVICHRLQQSNLDEWQPSSDLPRADQTRQTDIYGHMPSAEETQFQPAQPSDYARTPAVSQYERMPYE